MMMYRMVGGSFANKENFTMARVLFESIESICLQDDISYYLRQAEMTALR